MIIVEFLQYLIVVAAQWIISAYLLFKKFSFSQKKFPLCSISFVFVRESSVSNIWLSALMHTVLEVLIFTFYLYVKFKSNAIYQKFCINQAQLNLTSRIALEHCTRLTKTMLHVAIVHFCCFTSVFGARFGIVWWQDFYIIQRHHVDFEVLFNQGAVVIFMIAFAIIFLREIPALKAKLRSLFTKKKAGAVAPMTLAVIMKPESMLKREADVRFEHLAQQWAIVLPSKHKKFTK